MKLSLGVALLAALSGTAFADDPPPEKKSIDLSYLVDGGMIPFFWAPMAARLVLDQWVGPPATPLLFSSSEGGATPATWEVPAYALAGLGAGVGLGILASGDESRWYHLKGLGESVMTSVFITGGLKNLFGRHRPDWSPATRTASASRSRRVTRRRRS